MTYKQLRLPILIILLVTFFDQLTKFLILDNLAYGESVEVLGNFFKLTLIFNEGGAMGTNFGSSNYYLISALLILCFLLYYIYANRDNKTIIIPLSFIAGGAIGNLIDRFRFGKVVDFLDFDFFNINLFGFTLDRFWVFNIADSAISVSIVWLLIIILISKDKNEKKIESSDAIEESIL